MRVNSVNITRFGTYFDPLAVRQKTANNKVPDTPVTTYKAETPEQLGALQEAKDARIAYNAVKNDKSVDNATKKELERALKLAEKAYLRSIGLSV